MDPYDVELAGFVDGDGNLGRPVPSGKIFVPGEVWLEGDAIRWRRGEAGRLQEVSRTMLNQFVRLTSPESILRFAKTWGVLSLSEDEPRRPGRQGAGEGAEPIDAWRYYARRARAVLQIAGALKLGRLGDLQDWSTVGVLVPSSGYAKKQEELVKTLALRPHFGMGFSVIPMGQSPQENVEAARGFIGNEVGLWLDCWKREKTGGVSDFALRWNEAQGRWNLQIDYHGLLFPAIALQIGLVIADADSLFTCSGCAVPYIRPRQRKRPKSGWANYCEQCSNEGVAKRRAVESYREKKAEAVRMRASGVPLQQIAQRLNTEAARVRGWVDKHPGNSRAPR
jgi:hypothetical protein